MIFKPGDRVTLNYPNCSYQGAVMLADSGHCLVKWGEWEQLLPESWLRLVDAPPHPRTGLCVELEGHQRHLETLSKYDAGCFPERLQAGLRDAVARLVVAIGSMKSYARLVDGIEKPPPRAPRVPGARKRKPRKSRKRVFLDIETVGVDGKPMTLTREIGVSVLPLPQPLPGKKLPGCRASDTPWMCEMKPDGSCPHCPRIMQ